MGFYIFLLIILIGWIFLSCKQEVKEKNILKKNNDDKQEKLKTPNFYISSTNGIMHKKPKKTAWYSWILLTLSILSLIGSFVGCFLPSKPGLIVKVTSLICFFVFVGLTLTSFLLFEELSYKKKLTKYEQAFLEEKAIQDEEQRKLEATVIQDESIGNQIKSKEDLIEQEKDKKEKILIKSINSGNFPIEIFYEYRSVPNSFKRVDRQEDYIKTVNDIVDIFGKGYLIFNKYYEDKTIDLIIKNFFNDNEEILNYGSFNPFILSRIHYEQMKIFDGENIYFDRTKIMDNAISKYKFINGIKIDDKSLFFKFRENKAHNEIDARFNDEFYWQNCDNGERDIYIKLLNNSYNSMRIMEGEDWESIDFFEPYMCKPLKNNFEYVADVPVSLFYNAVNMFINNCKCEFEAEERRENIVFDYIDHIYNKLCLKYKPVLLLKNGLLSKYDDLNEFVFYLIMQYKLNKYKKSNLKQMLKKEDLEHINTFNNGLLDDDIEYLYKNDYSVYDIVKIDNLLNESSIGNELIDLVKFNDEFKNIQQKNIYDKCNQLQAQNYIERLSEENYNSKHKISLSDIDLMSGYEFEKFVAKLFQKMGYKSYTTKESGDQGIDVIAEKQDVKVAIQCKCYNGVVGNHAIMEAVAGAKYYDANKVMVVTNSTFTKSAIELAKKNNVQLWDRKTLKEKMEEVL